MGKALGLIEGWIEVGMEVGMEVWRQLAPAVSQSSHRIERHSPRTPASSAASLSGKAQQSSSTVPAGAGEPLR